MTAYQTYRIFESREEAVAMQALLSKNGIPNSLEESKALFDTAIVGAVNIRKYYVKIPQDQFLTANGILEAAIDLSTLEVEDDYYLLAFTDEELLEVVNKKDEWGEFDFALAKKLLAERGINVTKEYIQRMEVERVQQLKTTEPGSSKYIIVGYLAAIASTFWGVVIGLFLLTAYRHMPDGTNVPKFDKSTRAHGKWIVALSVGVILAHFVYLFYYGVPFSPVRMIFWGFGRRFF